MNTFYALAYGRFSPRRGSAFATLLRWMRVYRQRQELSQLDDRLLRDIGVSRADAIQETMKPFWQV